MTSPDKIVHKESVLRDIENKLIPEEKYSDYIFKRSIQDIGAFFIRPFRNTWLRIIGKKNTDRIFTVNVLLDLVQAKKNRPLSYVETLKLAERRANHMYSTRQDYAAELKKRFNTEAAHQIIETVLDQADDYSNQSSIVEIQYKKPTGWFRKASKS